MKFFYPIIIYFSCFLLITSLKVHNLNNEDSTRNLFVFLTPAINFARDPNPRTDNVLSTASVTDFVLIADNNIDVATRPFILTITCNENFVYE